MKQMLSGCWRILILGISLVAMPPMGLLAQAQTPSMPPKSEAELLQRLESAVRAKDKAAILALYNWDGVADWIKPYMSVGVNDWVTRELKTAKVLPLPTNYLASGQSGNIRFHPNVQPTAIIELHFTDGYGSGFPCGRKGDFYYLPGVITEESPTPPDDSTNRIIRVQTEDGRSVAHTPVDANPPGAFAILRPKRPKEGEYMTDAQGRLAVPLTETNRSLTAATCQGFGYLSADAVTNHAVLVLRPWGRIEGVLKNHGHPATNILLELSLYRDFYRTTEPPRVRLAEAETLTDDQGRFAFDEVPPFQLVINRHEPQEVFGSHLWQVTVNPGETNHLNMELHGRPIIGRVVPDSRLAGNTNLDLAGLSASLLPLSKRADGMNRTIYFPIASNGAFHVDLVEPGDYRIAGDVWGPSNKLASLDADIVHVTEGETPIDLKTVPLTAAVNLKPRGAAPNFSVRDLDGQTVKLSEYRGKFVLLDFWATWCGPCVAETPNLKATFDAYGKDSRLAMISLSLDQDPSAPRRFKQSHDIAWTQGFLGDWSADKVTASYGVYSIPSIFLIGPDGKVLATGLRGEQIKAAVGEALKR